MANQRPDRPAEAGANSVPTRPEQAEMSNDQTANDATGLPDSVGTVINAVRAKFDSLEPTHKKGEWVELTVPPALLLEVAQFVRDNPKLQFNFLSSISAVDYGDAGFQVVYHLVSLPEGRRKLVLKVVPEGGRDDAVVPSVISIWPTADWHEREAWDLMGIQFTGHPDLRRILMREDWVGHPLRKDYHDERAPRERQHKEDWESRAGI